MIIPQKTLQKYTKEIDEAHNETGSGLKNRFNKVVYIQI